MKVKKLLLTVLGLGLLASCEDDAPSTPGTNDPGNNRVWILNEGNFQAGNSELGVYDLSNGLYSASIFSSTNTKQLGDVLQSATRIGEEVYLVVNNSGKIEVVDADDFETKGTITGLKSPRFALEVSPTEIYVSDLFSDSIAVVNPVSMTVTNYINISSTSEEMVMSNGKVFVANTFTSHVTVIEVSSGTVSTIATSFSPTALRVDKNGNVWVLCGGDPFNNINGALEMINSSTNTVEKSIALSTSSYTNKMAMNATKDSVYFLQGDVHKISIDASSVPATPFIDGSANTFYGLGYVDATKEVWMADAKDFNQKGDVLRYSRSGNALGSFAAGINPNGFLVDAD